MFVYKNLIVNDTILDKYLFPSERVIEAQLIDNSTILSLPDIETDVHLIDSQIPIIKGRSDLNHDGRLDLLVEYVDSYIGIVEIKKERLIEEHLSQLEAYLAESSQILQYIKDNYENIDLCKNYPNSIPSIIGILIGTTIDEKLAIKINSGYQFQGKIPIAAICINRFKDRTGNSYVIADTFFKGKGKDFTKYTFNGQKYGKSRLVLAIIKEYVNQNQNISFTELNQVFPYKLNKHWPPVRPLDNPQVKKPRYYTNEEDQIVLSDGTRIAVCTQWGIDTIENFIDYACNTLGFQIE